MLAILILSVPHWSAASRLRSHATEDMAAFVRELHGSLIGARDATRRVATRVTARWFDVFERVP